MASHSGNRKGGSVQEYRDGYDYDEPAYADSWDYGYGYSYGYGYAAMPRIDVGESLQPLIALLREYDARRQTLEVRGGRIPDLGELTKLLERPISLVTLRGKEEVVLTQQKQLRNTISVISYDLHLDIRQLSTHMPVYYICRTRHDAWGEYSLIVQDLYMSPGYPLTDERFVKLMDLGHEKYFLRLAQFRDQIGGAVALTRDAEIRRVDDVLYNLGRHVFQAAWHDDQRLAVLAARHMDLPVFSQAIELLYLCLSGELCELRGAVNEAMLRFFTENYPQPAIHKFLEMLAGLEGDVLTSLPQTAGALHQQLSAAFGRFLSTEVAWGSQGGRLPLWKILYANFSRLTVVGQLLKPDGQFHVAANALEQEARGIIGALLDQKHANVVFDACTVE